MVSVNNELSMTLEEQTQLDTLKTNIERIVHSDANEALIFSEELEKKALEFKSNYHLALAYNYLGYSYFNLRQLSNAIKFLEKSRILFKELNDIPALIKIIVSIGAVKRQLGDYTKALKLYFEVIQLIEANNIIYPNVYNNIATIYFNQKRYKDALNFFTTSLNICERSDEDYRGTVISVLFNIGNIHFELNDIEKAEHIYIKAIKIGRNLSKPILYIPCLRGLGKLYYDIGEFDKAYEFLMEGLQLSEDTHYFMQTIELSLVLADVLKQFGEYKKRRSLLKKSLSIALQHQNDSVGECLEKLLEHYEDIEDFKNAYLIIKQLLAYKEAVFEKRRSKKLAELQARFEFNELDKELALSREHEAQLEQRGTELELAGLRAQLNPHFMFNSLQAIQQYILHEVPINASDYLARFAKLMRLILVSSDLMFQSIEEECVILRNYLDLERLRFSEGFNYTIHFQKGIDPTTALIPTMYLQPFVENAVLHGVTKTENGRLQIFFRKQANILFVHILDNGPGINHKTNGLPKNGHVSRAVKILKARTRLLSNYKGMYLNYKILNRPKGGVHVGIMMVIGESISTI